LRGLRCRPDWEALPGKTVCVGAAGGPACPASITPASLTSAMGGSQWLCTKASYVCSVACSGEAAESAWTAEECAGGKDCSDPRRRAKLLEEASGGAGLAGAGDLADEEGDPAGGGPMVNLRGLECELKDGKERCFRQGASGEREMCPEHVTSSYLTKGGDQWLCIPGASDKYFCTVSCQEGNEDVRWGANEISWCNANKGSCPDPPVPVPQSKFKLKPWSAKPRAKRPCHSAPLSDDPIPDVTFAVLTNGARETRTFSDTLRTYEENGLLKRAAEVLVFVNKRDAGIDSVLKPYVERHGPRFKVLGNAKNHGITWAIDWLVGNATQPFLLFLEKDFHLIEPAECVREQMASGVRLIREDKAQVVRYRSRDRPGRPNWAEMMFKGDEERVFKQQANLFCNHYYWIPHPEETWPDKIWRCQDEPAVFYCSKAKYCNWTNNPTLMGTKWWQDEYVNKRFKVATRHDPYDHLEMYMNWEPGSWNDEPFVVGQGDGLFKHVDRNNFT